MILQTSCYLTKNILRNSILVNKIFIFFILDFTILYQTKFCLRSKTIIKLCHAQIKLCFIAVKEKYFLDILFQSENLFSYKIVYPLNKALILIYNPLLLTKINF